jgi:hypothetical protein
MACLRRPLAGHVPAIAGVILCTALGTVALAKIPTAFSITPAASTTGSATQESAPVRPDVAAQPLFCEQQTWPYIDRSCAGSEAGGKRLVRVISPETSRITEAKAPLTVAANETPTAGNSIAASFASLTPPAAVPAQQFAPAPTARRDAERYEAPAVRRTAEVKRVKVSATRSASRLDRPVDRRAAAADVVAQGDTYQVRRVYVEAPDVAHGLY